MKICVTGGAGFVGSNLVRLLCHKNFETIVVDDLSTGLKKNLQGINCEVRQVSICDLNSLKLAMKDCDYIFHLAARGSVPRSIKNPRATFEVNVAGTMNVLECAKDSGATVAFASSSSVYGANIELPKNEKMWLAPLTPYAASKLSGEALVQSYASTYNVKAITYRFFNIFGPWQRPDHDYAAVIPKWIWKLMKGEEIQVFGDGNVSRDFTHIDSVVSVLLDGMSRGVLHSEPINLAFGARITLKELIGHLRIRFPEMKVRYSPNRPGDVGNSQNDPKLLTEWFPNIKCENFYTALERTIDWYEENGNQIVNGPRIED